MSSEALFTCWLTSQGVQRQGGQLSSREKKNRKGSLFLTVASKTTILSYWEKIFVFIQRRRMLSAVELPDAARHYQAVEAWSDPQAGDI